jgi:hypothetical protein
MPIRFRCAYCNQLLGIAHRKAGTIVRCPTCAGQVVVPDPGAEGTEKGTTGAPGEELLFERSDFDELFNPGEKRAQLPVAKPEKVLSAASLPDIPSGVDVPAAPAAAARPAGSHPGLDVVRVPTPGGPRAPQPGIVLTSKQATWLAVAAVAALVLAFALGLLVGLLLRSSPAPQARSSERVLSVAVAVVEFGHGRAGD